MRKRTMRRRIIALEDQVAEQRLTITELRGDVQTAEALMTGFRRGLAWNQPPADTAARAAARAGDPIPGVLS